MNNSRSGNISNLSMYHYKYDRPNNNPWQKDRAVVLQDLLKGLAVETIPEEGNKTERNKMMSQTTPKNIIMYGPPGTGKTYHTIYKSLELLDPSIDKDLLDNPDRRDEAAKLFNEYKEKNQIMFCTFHQSYSYEDFVEGYRFNPEKEGFEVKDGLFKTLCHMAHPQTSERQTTYQFDEDQVNFFKMSLGNIYKSESEQIYHYCIENNVIALGYGGAIDYSNCTEKSEIEEKFRAKYSNDTPFNIDAIERFKNWMRNDDIVIISSGNKKAKAIGRINGGYYYNPNTEIRYKHFRPVEWLYTDTELPVNAILKGKRFSQQSIYMFYREDINVESLRNLLTDDSDNNKKTPHYVLIIDEINRGNISKIFGELITLIEPDKRLGSKNELTVTLPYSGDIFGIPSNLHILGTMNTADRSISLLDTALRRRFEFIEMMPDYSLLPTDTDGVNIRQMLKALNERIEYLFDRDHVIGHALFLSEEKIENYLKVMQSKVIPLLQEYFYDNWEQIELVLGGSGSKGDEDVFLWKEEIDSKKLFGKNVHGNNPLKYSLNPFPSKNALLNVYENYQADEE
ncbi:AAA family ATPase [Siminovitchia fortis]|uniref:AAA family ATPase n=2 Tax=Siminovitchia fortis TaxID=254758 RepID=UPI001FD07491|nr:AAA family ATPase [Siminovitchia fortis]